MRATALRKKVRKELDAATKRNKRAPDTSLLDSERPKRRKLAAGVVTNQPCRAEALPNDASMLFGAQDLPQADPSQAIKHLDMAMAPTAYQQHQTPLWLSGECDPDRLGQNVITSTPIWLMNSSANFPTTSFQTDNLSVANSLQTGYQFDEVAYEG